MKDYQTYLFDVDGTLLDTMELIYRSFVNTLAQYGGPELDRDYILSHVGRPLPVQLEMYLGPLGEREGEILEVHRSYQARIYRDYLEIFPRVEEVLRELKQRGKVLAVVTSRTAPSLLRYLDHFHLTGYFDLLVEPSCTEKHKPHPEPVLYALDRLNRPPEQTLFVGDASVDMLSGQAAGVDTAFVLWGPNDPNLLEPSPTWLLRSMDDLLV
ncbi:MAG: HAD-IA family hydrolase [Spirochaetales bacterium]|nr:HAD-IA family hydrolase [Spirochaetales bacterium]